LSFSAEIQRGSKEVIEMIEVIQAVTEKYDAYAAEIAQPSSMLISLLRCSG
jgi:hypothetical protein